MTDRREIEQGMARNKNIVAAELLGIKDKVSLIDAIAFPLAGDAIAGLAGAFVGASLVPTKYIFHWHVLCDDGTYDTFKLDHGDPRNDLLMELPYLPDYEAYLESWAEMTDELSEQFEA